MHACLPAEALLQGEEQGIREHAAKKKLTCNGGALGGERRSSHGIDWADGQPNFGCAQGRQVIHPISAEQDCLLQTLQR